MHSKKILITCFDVSGDHNAADLIQYANLHFPQEFQFLTIAGEEVAALNHPTHPTNKKIDNSTKVLQLRSHVTESSVGILEALPYIFPTLKFFRWFKAYLKKNPVDLLLCIDGQGRNIKLGQIAHKLNIKTAYFFPPQVSIYGAWNIKKMRPIFDLLLCPFYADHQLYLNGGLNSVFTGHPFGQLAPLSAEEQTTYSSNNEKLVSIFPGSRFQEIDNLLPIFLQTAKEIKQRHPETSFIISCAHQNLHPHIDQLVKQHQDQYLSSNQLPLKIVHRDWNRILKSSYFILASSGTVTLKASFWGIPHAICYKISRLSYLVGKIIIKVNYIGMANILANREICREFINRDLTVKNLTTYATKILSHSKYHNQIKSDLLKETKALKSQDTFKMIFNAIREVLKK